MIINCMLVFAHWLAIWIKNHDYVGLTLTSDERRLKAWDCPLQVSRKAKPAGSGYRRGSDCAWQVSAMLGRQHGGRFSTRTPLHVYTNDDILALRSTASPRKEIGCKTGNRPEYTTTTPKLRMSFSPAISDAARFDLPRI